ncbi:MAG: hypothetical protein U1F57_07455 [bacterium]
MSFWFLLPFILQALVMIADEFYFHYRRGLPLWERIGHPLDTLTVLACFGWIYWQAPTVFHVKVYVALAIFSILFVTKDGKVHTRYCVAGENWLHDLLFILHPLVLIAAFLIWPSLHPDALGIFPASWETSPFLRKFFQGQLLLMILFWIYQIVYWNFLWKAPESLSPKSTTTSMMP